MLYLTFKRENLLEFPGEVFDNSWFDDWFDNPLVQEMIMDIDRSEVVSANSIISPVLGNISYERLSTGVKGLVLMLLLEDAEEIVFQSARYGDNCFPWIWEIAKMKDIHLCVNSFFKIPKDDTYTAICMENGKQYTGDFEIMGLCLEGRSGDPHL